MPNQQPLLIHETCAGGMAFASHLAGNTTNLMPNWGNKWRYRKDLEDIARGLLPDCSFEVGAVTGTDPGGWGHAAAVLFDADLRAEVVSVLHDMQRHAPPADWYAMLHRTGYGSARDRPSAIARFLYMQRIAFGNKPVEWRPDGVLVSSGYNKTTAEGTPATDRFGAVKPQVPSMIRRLERMTADVRCGIDCAPADALGRDTYALSLPFARLEVIDPPYRAASGYHHCFGRAAVVRRARAQRRGGWAVMVCETEPIPELVAEGWDSKEITKTRNGASPVRSKAREFVTFSDGHC